MRDRREFLRKRIACTRAPQEIRQPSGRTGRTGNEHSLTASYSASSIKSTSASASRENSPSIPRRDPGAALPRNRRRVTVSLLIFLTPFSRESRLWSRYRKYRPVRRQDPQPIGDLSKMKTLLQCGLLSLFLAATLPAVPLIQTYDFTGTCSDCPGFGYGTLTASTSNNVVSFSFSYNSDWISYTIPSVSTLYEDGFQFNGTSYTYNPAATFFVIGNGTFTSFGGSGNPVPPGTTQENIFFSLNPNGNWSTGINAPSDFGTNGAFNLQGGGNSGVPEPASIALVGAGTGLLILLQRRRSA
jgi:hypothetical protein